MRTNDDLTHRISPAAEPTPSDPQDSACCDDDCCGGTTPDSGTCC
ncbi:MAG TPA: hypothetical protein VF584_17450 [Longimicrobium sp.]|jgi:hypothetical protein